MMNNKFVCLLWEGFGFCRAVITMTFVLSIETLPEVFERPPLQRDFSLFVFAALCLLVAALWSMRLHVWLEAGMSGPEATVAGLRQELSVVREAGMSLAAGLAVAFEDIEKLEKPAPAGTYESRPAAVRAGYVYLLKEVNGEYYKIGRTREPNNRLRTFKVKLPFQVTYLCLIQTEDMYALETELHWRFKDKRVNGEWFALSDDDVASMMVLAQEGQA